MHEVVDHVSAAEDDGDTDKHRNQKRHVSTPLFVALGIKRFQQEKVLFS